MHELVVRSTAIVRTAEMICDITVASATPATPILNLKTNRKSRHVFAMAQTIRKYKGLVESPTARIIPAPIL